MRIVSKLLVPVSCSIAFAAAALVGCTSETGAETDSSNVSAAQVGAAGDSCGTRGQAVCGQGLDCIFPVTAACGAADKPGTCRARQLGFCATIYDPVCGCDGKTYSSTCDATAAGASVRSAGECPTSTDGGTPLPEAGTGGIGATCGTRGAATCEAGLFCQFPVSAACGATDKPGACAQAPAICSKEVAPVCGCDGKTYSNACTAASSGASVRANGECK